MSQVLVVQSKVRQAIKKQKCNMSGDFAEDLSKVVAEMVADACNRAKSNGRKTVRGYDL